MKINFDTKLKDLEDEDIKSGPDTFLDLKAVTKTVLMMSFEDEKDLSGSQKLDRYVLACKIRSGGECDLQVEDIALIKKLIGKAYGPLIVGQSWQALENKPEA